jgi:selenophosphate synthase
LPVGEEAKVADAHEAAREQVQEEATQKLLDRQGYEPLLVAVSGISPAEGDVAIREGDKSVVG